MSEPRWFYRTESEWTAIVERLKLTPCPHCKTVGALIRHGSLHGFDDQSPRRPTLRARRIFCSNRYRRSGCGRTVSVWLASKLRRISLTTPALLAFLLLAVSGGVAAAIRSTLGHLSCRTWQRIWKRFDLAQSRLRTALLSRGPPPPGPPGAVRSPATAQVLAHFHACFPHADCPLAAFQQATRSFVL